ncbi:MULTISPECIES: PilW family protein [unclassified Moraxella]|uniref:PilW family protein n=1 Tax=unclassified Moraxella TaxID=2685852 RepID=UPI00359D1914
MCDDGGALMVGFATAKTRLRVGRRLSNSCGLSLLEMMIALLIASMVVLMVAQAYVMSLNGIVAQENLTYRLQHQIFGVQGLTESLRLAGLGIDDKVLSQPNPQGVLVHIDQLSHQSHSVSNLARYLSRADVQPKNNRTTMPTHQLTIIYRAPQDMWDCEGEMALGPRNARLKGGKMRHIEGQVVIERYFVQNNDGVMNLRCDAARFVPESITRDGTRDRRLGRGSSAYIKAIIDTESSSKAANTIIGVGSQGDVIASHVEGLWVEVGVASQDGIRFMPITEYANHANQDEPIVMMNVAFLGYSPTPSARDDAPRDFEIFGKKVVLQQDSPSHDRWLYHFSVRLRNVMGNVVNGGAIDRVVLNQKVLP